MHTVARTLMIWSLAVSAATARDLFVDNVAGDDANDGRQPQSTVAADGPWRTINHALAEAGPGDRIILTANDEPYRESISLTGGRHSGNPFTPFVIEGNGAILDGSAPVPGEAWEPYEGRIYRLAPRRKHFGMLFVDDQPLPRASTTSADGQLPALEPQQWTTWRGHLYFRVGDNDIVEQYRLTYARLQVGVTLYKVEYAIVRNLIVQGFQQDGVGIHDARRCALIALTARGNGRSGIAVAGASEVTVHSCLSGFNGHAQLHVDGPSTVTVTATQLNPTSAPRILRRRGRVYITAPPAAADGAAGQDDAVE